MNMQNLNDIFITVVIGKLENVGHELDESLPDRLGRGNAGH
jgi:hypothetical protein